MHAMEAQTKTQIRKKELKQAGAPLVADESGVHRERERPIFRVISREILACSKRIGGSLAASVVPSLRTVAATLSPHQVRKEDVDSRGDAASRITPAEAVCRGPGQDCVEFT